MIFPFTLPGVGALLLQGALALTGVPVVEGGYLCDDKMTLGGFVEDTQQIELCYNNMEDLGYDRGTVVRHEAIHVIHSNLGLHDGSGRTFLYHPVLTHLARRIISEEQAYVILFYYDTDEINQEFEAHLGQNLPDEVVAVGVAASHIYYTFTGEQR